MQLTVWCFCLLWPPAGRMVVGHSVSGVAHPLSAQCELWWPSTLPGALLATCRGNLPAEGQYYHMAHTAVLEPASHVRRAHSHVWKLCFRMCCSVFFTFKYLSDTAYFRERLAPQKAGKTPLDMDQFRMLFCTCKVPGVKKDTIRNYFKTGRINSALIFAANLPAALWPFFSACFSPLCNVHAVLSHRAWGSMPLPFGSDVPGEDIHIWCTLWWRNPHSSRNSQVKIKRTWE